MINNDIKYKFFLISHHDNKPHLIFTIKFDKDNVYFINSGFIKNFKTKISYHTPRLPSNKSQVHFKVNDRRINDADLCCPANEIKGVRYFGGSGTPLDQLINLPIFKKEKRGEKCFIFDSRKLRMSHLSSIQWSWFFVEPDQEESLYKHPIIDNGDSEFSESMHIQLIKETIPWVGIEYIRIREENPIWYK